MDIHIIYYVNSTVKSSGELDFEFTSSGIKGTPAQLCTLDAEEVTNEVGGTNYCYTEGYVTMKAGDMIPVNFYADLLLVESSIDKTDPNYGKILVAYNLTV